MKTILLVSHGSRVPESITVCEKVKNDLENLINDKIELCYMELSKPSIEEKVEELYNKGYRNIIVLPFFLFEGMHIKMDIPKILEELAKKFKISFCMAKPIGYDKRLAYILKERLDEVGESCV
ncbi:MAG: CbiX/SirB N-terminal domain-containing protein [Fervidobacterium sp.]